jgi:hypothetical protein
MDGMHIAEFNFGTLKHDWDDPRVKGFVDGLDLVNGAAERSDGFIWRLSDAELEASESDADVFEGNDRIAATLSVWRDVESLDQFVWNTVHRQFYARKAEWYDAIGNGNLVLWWVPEGHRPGLAEGMDRWRHWDANGNSDHAFGWSHVKEAQLWKARNCSAMAAE